MNQIEADWASKMNESLKRMSIRTGGGGQPPAPNSIPLGEELPLFCESCGYPLHGAPQIRCDKCALLHFHCPECGRRQSINTLRPAVVRAAARARGTALALWVLIKLGAIGGGLFGWFVLAADMSHILMYGQQSQIVVETIVLTFLFGVPYGGVSRMLLLRWGRAWLIGIVLALLAAVAMLAGASLMAFGTQGMYLADRITVGMPMLCCGALFTLIGAICAWPVWVGAVRLLLPRRTGQQLLAWQQDRSDRSLGIG